MMASGVPAQNVGMNQLPNSPRAMTRSMQSSVDAQSTSASAPLSCVSVCCNEREFENARDALSFAVRTDAGCL